MIPFAQRIPWRQVSLARKAFVGRVNEHCGNSAIDHVLSGLQIDRCTLARNIGFDFRLRCLQCYQELLRRLRSARAGELAHGAANAFGPCMCDWTVVVADPGQFLLNCHDQVFFICRKKRRLCRACFNNKLLCWSDGRSAGVFNDRRAVDGRIQDLRHISENLGLSKKNRQTWKSEQ